jgi:hypothetical protein
MESKVILECLCKHAIVAVEKDEEFDQYYFAFYRYSLGDSFWRRIKTVWKYLWKGERILLEDIIITQEQFKKLKEWE